MATKLLLLLVLTIVSSPFQSNADSWNVIASGAVANGQTDCTIAFQNALDLAAKAGGGVVDVPAGCYRINGQLAIPANVTLQGIYRVPPTTGSTAITNLSGSVLFAYAGRGSTNGKPFIRLAGNNSAIAGLIIAYPEWKQTDVLRCLILRAFCLTTLRMWAFGTACSSIPMRASSWSVPLGTSFAM